MNERDSKDPEELALEKHQAEMRQQAHKLREIVGANVRNLRKGQDMSQRGLSELINISLDMMGRIERGKAAPSFETIVKLADALEVSSHNLFDVYARSPLRGSRGEILNQINIELSTKNEMDLSQILRLVQALD